MMRLRIASVSSASGHPEDLEHSEKEDESLPTQTVTIAESLQKSTGSTVEASPTDSQMAEKKEPVGWNVPVWAEPDAKEKAPAAIVIKDHRSSDGSGPMIVETTIEAPPLPKKKWYRRIPCF